MIIHPLPCSSLFDQLIQIKSLCFLMDLDQQLQQSTPPNPILITKSSTHDNHQFKFSPSSYVIFIKREFNIALISFLLLILSLILLLNLINTNHSPFQPNSLLQFLRRSNQSITLEEEVCDYSNGRWVRDNENDHVPLYTEDCPFLDPGFRCHRNGRKDQEYLKWLWQPKGCDLPRFNAIDFLERSRNGRIVFAGDSIGRNQWESLVCMLAQTVSNKSAIYEANGNPITKHKGSLSIRFHQYNLTVEYYRVPFLVTIGRPPKNSSNEIRSSIRVDELQWCSKQWIGANVLVFNAGHWWNEGKTVKMGYFFQEGGAVNMSMNVIEAYRRSLQTWKSWVSQNLDPLKTHIFFRSYSPTHFREKNWNEGGRCDVDTVPETNLTKMETESWHNRYIRDTIEQMKDVNPTVALLNITYLTEFRKDGHPSIHREPGTPVPFHQDCSHWCLPGVPDTWNHLLYAHLLSRGYRSTGSVETQIIGT